MSEERFELSAKETTNPLQEDVDGVDEIILPHMMSFQGGVLGMLSFSASNIALQGNLPALYSGPAAGPVTGAAQAVGTGIASVGVYMAYMIHKGNQIKETIETLENLEDEEGATTAYFYPETENVANIIESSDYVGELNESDNFQNFAADYEDLINLLEEGYKPNLNEEALEGVTPSLIDITEILDSEDTELQSSEEVTDYDDSGSLGQVLRHKHIDRPKLGDSLAYRLEVYSDDEMYKLEGITTEDEFFGHLEADFAGPTL